jgi:hypothetical protein
MRHGPLLLTVMLCCAGVGCVRYSGASLTRGPVDAGAEDAGQPVDRAASTVDTGEDRALPDAPADLGPDVGPDVGVDAAADVGVDPLKPFGTPQPAATINSSYTEDDPTLTADMLEIYFNRQGDIWRSQRSSVSGSWSAPAVDPALSSSAGETNPEITGDGLTIYFASNRAHARASGGHDIFRATRPTRAAAWSAPVPVPALNTTDDDHPGVSTDDRIMIITSTRPGTLGEHDFFETSRASAGAPWGPVKWVKNASTSEHEVSPWIDATGTVLYWASNRGGLPEVKIWVATRADPSQAFSTPKQVGSLNLTEKEEDPWLSPDLRTVYFARRVAGKTDMDICWASR